MRVLVLCPHFDPDAAPTGVVMTEIAGRLIDLGHELEIVTSLPWYTDHRIEPGWGRRLWRSERTAWGRIIRVHPFPTNKTNIPARALGFAGFTALAGLAGLFRRRRPDVVLTMSPPLTLGLAGWVAARIRRVPIVFNVQDIFPDVAIEVGAVENPRVVSALRWLERFVYRRCDAITVLSTDLQENVAAKIGDQPAGKVRVIPNFVDIDRISPSERTTKYREEVGAGDQTLVMYAGNMGFSQPLDLVLDTAERWRDRDDVLFVLNGGGSERPRLEERARALPNVRFMDYQPVERLSEVLASADVHLILLRRGLARSSVPSKLYSILAAGRPVLASIDPGTEVQRVLTDNACGLAVGPEDPDAFESALDDLVADRAARQEMGQRGRAFVEAWVSPTGVAKSYADLFSELIVRSRRGSGPQRR